jgi:hypothetical protein
LRTLDGKRREVVPKLDADRERPWVTGLARATEDLAGRESRIDALGGGNLEGVAAQDVQDDFGRLIAGGN